ncbi:hypothetical protein M9458_057157, partial [Cirrhinus mrigala]
STTTQAVNSATRVLKHIDPVIIGPPLTTERYSKRMPRSVSACRIPHAGATD